VGLRAELVKGEKGGWFKGGAKKAGKGKRQAPGWLKCQNSLFGLVGEEKGGDKQRTLWCTGRGGGWAEIVTRKGGKGKQQCHFNWDPRKNSKEKNHGCIQNKQGTRE